MKSAQYWFVQPVMLLRTTCSDWTVGWIGRALSHQLSLSVHSPSRCSSEAALTNLLCAPTPFLKCRRLCKRCPFQWRWEVGEQSTCGKCNVNKVHVVALSLDFVWEDELRGLSELASARNHRSRLLLPHVAVRLILSFLTLPRSWDSPRVSGVWIGSNCNHLSVLI